MYQITNKMDTYDEFSKAKYVACIYLARRMHTKSEMYNKLIKKEYTPEICEKTIEALIELGYINDVDYVERYTKDATNLKKHGINRIRRDLKQKGIDEETIDKTISELDIENSEILAKLVEQKADRLDLKDIKQKNRLIGFLLRRGYKYDEIFNAIREYCDNKGEI